MITIRFSGRTPSPREITIGQETDSNADKLRFILPEIGDGQYATLQMIMPDGMPDTILIEDGMITIPARLAEIAGRSRAWVEILAGNTVAWHSELFYLDVGELPPISERTEQEYPTALQKAIEAAVKSLRYKSIVQQSAKLILAGSELWSVFVEGTTLNINHELPENAYEIAVKNGYEGTEEEWEALVEAVGDQVSIEEAMETAESAKSAADSVREDFSSVQSKANSAYTLAEETNSALQTLDGELDAVSSTANSALSNAAYATTLANAANTLAGKKATASAAGITVAASLWSGNTAPYTATAQCGAAKTGNTLVVGPGAMTKAQAEEMARCGIYASGQGNGTITLQALYAKPTIALPISVLGVEP